jgi:hypothetical protein
MDRVTPPVLRRLAATLRGPPRPGENLRAADALEAAAAELEAVAGLRDAAEGVVRSYDAGKGPRWPAIEALAVELKGGNEPRGSRGAV